MQTNNLILPSQILQVQLQKESAYMPRENVSQLESLIKYLDILVISETISLDESINIFLNFQENSVEKNQNLLYELESRINSQSRIADIFGEILEKNFDQKLGENNIADLASMLESIEDPKDLYEVLQIIYDNQIPEEIQKQYQEYTNIGKEQNTEVMALDTLTQALEYKVKGSINKPLTVEELINKVERSRDAKKLEKQQVAQAVSTITGVSSKPKAPSNLNKLN